MTVHRTGESRARGATAEKHALLLALVDEVKAIRDEVEVAAPADVELHEAVGLGSRLNERVSQDAVSIAAMQQDAFKHKDLGPRLRAAGITSARIARLEATRRKVAGAEVVQGDARGAKTGDGASKTRLVRELGRWNTRAIKTGMILAKNDPKIRASFEQFRIRRRKKAKTGTPPASPPPTPAK